MTQQTAYDWTSLREATWGIVERTFPGRFVKDNTCFLWSAVLAEGMRPFGGAMAAGGASLEDQSISTWGVMINPAKGEAYCTADDAVDEVGTYNGHCWVAVPTGEWDWQLNRAGVKVYDAMGRYAGGLVQKDPLIVYYPRGALLTSIKRFYKAEIAAARKATRKDGAYLALCAQMVEAVK